MIQLTKPALAAGIVLLMTFLASNAVAQSCDELGGTCMEGCEPGFEDLGQAGCFDSTCCIPDPAGADNAQSCDELGGTCMEGCEPGFEDLGQAGCFDSTCCVPEPAGTDNAYTCNELGGVCMEGCEPGFAQTTADGCFDSACCIAEVVSCEQAGGTCGEPCAADQRSIDGTDCQPNRCCLPPVAVAGECEYLDGVCTLGGCLEGFRADDSIACADDGAVCCNPVGLFTGHPEPDHRSCVDDTDCNLVGPDWCCGSCTCRPPYAMNDAGVAAQLDYCSRARCAQAPCGRACAIRDVPTEAVCEAGVCVAR